MQINPDFSILEQKVLDFWEADGYDWKTYEQDCDDPVHYSLGLTDYASEVLNDPNRMLEELGYNSGDYATFIREEYAIWTKI